MNRKGEILGVLSHETALSIYELSDVNPVKIHMTVPRGFRRHGEIPSVLKLHFSPMHAPEYEQNGGYRVTRPFRTIADLVRGALLPADVIVQAVREGLQKGVLTRTQYAKLLEMPRVGNSLKRMMGDFA